MRQLRHPLTAAKRYTRTLLALALPYGVHAQATGKLPRVRRGCGSLSNGGLEA